MKRHLALATVASAVFFSSCTKNNSAVTSSGVFGSVLGKDVKGSDLSQAEQRMMYEAELKIWQTGHEIMARKYLNDFFERYQKENNLPTTEEAQRHYFETHSQISDVEVRKFLAEHKDNPALKQMPTEQERLNAIRGYLSELAKRKSRQTLVEEGEAKGDFKYTATTKPQPPALKLPSTDYTKGPNNAKVVVAKFADYQCHFCLTAHKILKDLEKIFEGKSVRFEEHDFPIVSIHSEAMPAAIAARCAYNQGKYWEMHDDLYEKLESFDKTSPANVKKGLGMDFFNHLAKSLGLDMAKFDACMKDPATAKTIENSLNGAKDLIQGTPSIFINGVLYDNAPTVEALKKAIEEKL